MGKEKKNGTDLGLQEDCDIGQEATYKGNRVDPLYTYT